MPRTYGGVCRGEEMFEMEKNKNPLESKHNGLENLIYFQFLLPAAVSLPKAVKWFYSDASYVFAIVRTTVNIVHPSSLCFTRKARERNSSQESIEVPTGCLMPYDTRPLVAVRPLLLPDCSIKGLFSVRRLLELHYFYITFY